MTTPMLDVRDVRVRLGRADILRGASLVVAPGEIVVLLGPNGSGKTTLLRAAMGFVAIASGTVAWRGEVGVARDPRRLATIAAYLPQHPTTVPLQRVAEAIAVGRFAVGSSGFLDDAADRAATARAAERTGVSDLLGRRVADVSGGQRQRVFFARALAQETPALVLDEPASFLDLRHQLDVCRLLRDVATRLGTAVLMTSHDLNLAAAFADRVVVMNDGTIVADGPPGDALTVTLIADVFGVTARRIDVDGRPRWIAVV